MDLAVLFMVLRVLLACQRVLHRQNGKSLQSGPLVLRSYIGSQQHLLTCCLLDNWISSYIAVKQHLFSCAYQLQQIDPHVGHDNVCSGVTGPPGADALSHNQEGSARAASSWASTPLDAFGW